MIITITNLIQESLAKHDLNYELSGDSRSKRFLIRAADALLLVNVWESIVYVFGMYKHKIPRNQGQRLRELCKTLNDSGAYTYNLHYCDLMCMKRIAYEEVINDPDVVHRELVEICNRLTNFYVTNIEVPSSGGTSGGLRSKNKAPAALKQRIEAVSASVTDALRELENIKAELENYKSQLEEKAQAARDRADSYSTWNDGAEDRASELEDKFSDIEGLYDEIDSAYDELFNAEMSLSSAVMGAYVLE